MRGSGGNDFYLDSILKAIESLAVYSSVGFPALPIFLLEK